MTHSNFPFDLHWLVIVASQQAVFFFFLKRAFPEVVAGKAQACVPTFILAVCHLPVSRPVNIAWFIARTPEGKALLKEQFHILAKTQESDWKFHCNSHS